MLRRRPPASAILAVLLVVAVGAWSRDDPDARPVSSFTLLHPVAPSAPPPAVPARPVPAAPAGGVVLRNTGGTDVALTFDDGPGDQTLAILALLRQYGVKATFCLIGVHVRARPDLVQAIVRDGHTLCNHTWQHDMLLGTRSPDAIRSDLRRTSDEIHRAVPGIPIRYFRHPGGKWTPAAVEVAQDMGMASLGWDVDPSDWNVQAYPPGPAMTNHIVANIRNHIHPGAIVLSHDGGGVRTSTVEAYRTLIPYLIDERQLRLIALPNRREQGQHEGRHPRLTRFANGSRVTYAFGASGGARTGASPHDVAHVR
jgi:peptidoglycan/xylan/chitin deacetylase (PgdA/CDA1 family)